MIEKRKSNRLTKNEETFISQDKTQKKGIKIIDISLGGMRVMMNEELKIGTILLGQFNILPNDSPFYIKGEVAWSKPSQEENNSYQTEIGIRFTQISAIPFLPD